MSETMQRPERVSIDHDRGEYHHVSREGSQYRELCSPDALDRTDVYDGRRADLDGLRECHRCAHLRGGDQ